MYIKCADCESQEQDKASHLTNAAMCVKEHDVRQYMQLVNAAIQLCQISGKTSKACDLSKDCAEKLEEDYNYEQARELYNQAAILYKAENLVNFENQMNAKWASMTILLGDFEQIASVIAQLEKIAKYYLKSSIAKASARPYFFKAILCFLANDDMQGCKNAIETYNFEDPLFEQSYHFKFVCQMIEAIEARSSENLAQVIAANVRIISMDKAESKLLTLIKKLLVKDNQIGVGQAGSS